MKSSAPRPMPSKAAVQALLSLIGERFPIRAKKLMIRLHKGQDTSQEILIPVRMMVYNLLEEQSYERYTDYERAALRGDAVAEEAWLRMLSVCRILLRRPAKVPEICLN